MSTGVVTHLLRAPVVGGSELEALTIVRTLTAFEHRVVYPARFAGWQPSLRRAFVAAGARVAAVSDVERELQLQPPELLHIQFPFVLTERARGLDSVLELRAVPAAPTLFTVHAAVNVPVVPEVHYVFHTAELAGRFADRLADGQASVCPSLVPLPEDGPAPVRTGDEVVALWVARNEDGKFHPELAEVLPRLLEEEPRLRLRFVGHPLSWDLPEHPRLSVQPCPAPDLAAEYRAADLFVHLPDPRLEETWCRTVTEALGHGLPCVVASHGAMARQVEDGLHGRVVDTPEEGAAAVLELARDPDLRRALGAAGPERAAAFHAEARQTLTTLYERVLAAGG